MIKVFENNQEPLVSVIIATYNSDLYLEQCINSILNQTYSKFELLIIDGGSTDKTVSIIKKYESVIKYWISEPDKGVYDAWNKAIDKSSGSWLTFIGSDDIFYPNALELYVKHIISYDNSKELEFVSSKIDLVDNDLALVKIVGEPWNWHSFKQSMVTWHVGSFHSRQLFDKYGLFDSSYKISGDYEFLLRPKDLLNASYINVRTVKMRNGGLSNNRLIDASNETYNAKIKNGLLSPFLGNLLRYIDRARLIFRSI
ncbi:glycosyltransferase family 2 protein [Spirosoma agri]|uniref:Glycosyltransferase n=1 Tax=Spirosoma agri TaxID=1987381 RepID=A0A6M0IND3_9BACT|nr:glycosyltransferase family 2 protein [Spirosoma agri]NEU68851.1 glycosyltransferase [Spirosoma agri]